MPSFPAATLTSLMPAVAVFRWGEPGQRLDLFSDNVVPDASTRCGEALQRLNNAGSPGWIRTSDHSINSRMLYR
jgi:hypothetical protein